MISLPGLKYTYARVHSTSSELANRQQGPSVDGHTTLTFDCFPSGHKLWAWLRTDWPLILHFLGACGIVVLLESYVNDNHFNVRERMPAVTLANGTIVRTTHFSPLQSDINTMLSASLVVLRWITAAWAGPMCWRTLFFLMEKTALQRRDMEWLIGYGFLPLPTQFRNRYTIIVTAILTSTLLAQSASPILTGSITWAPSYLPYEFQSDAFVDVPFTTNNSVSWQSYAQPAVQANIALKAAGFANQAWGLDAEKGVLKRVLPSADRLPINSAIANLTLPYFQVTALEWILDPETYNLTKSTLYESELSSMQIDFLDQTLSMLAILPSTPRRSMGTGTAQVVGSEWPLVLPPPSTVSETRMLVLNAAPVLSVSEVGANQECAYEPIELRMLVPTERSCLMFGQVTYTAGAGVCTNCRLSSPSTVQNDSEVSLQPDTMTIEALWSMPNVTANLVVMNTSIPSPWGHDGGNSYVKEVLFRSYSGAWSALHEVMVDPEDTPLFSRAYPTLLSLQAQLDSKRVRAWLNLQIVAICTGILFRWLQSRSKYALTSDTTMVAFDLDTTDADAKSLLKIEPKDDGWKVVVDPQSPKNL